MTLWARVATAIYPGSFDPLTNGHLSIIHRGLTVFDRLIVAVANNPRKQAMFTAEQRKALIREAMPDSRVEVDAFQGLLVHYTRKKDVHVILRGLRAVSDFEYEFQLANMNRKLDPQFETVFMMTGAGLASTSRRSWCERWRRWAGTFPSWCRRTCSGRCRRSSRRRITAADRCQREPRPSSALIRSTKSVGTASGSRPTFTWPSAVGNRPVQKLP